MKKRIGKEEFKAKKQKNFKATERDNRHNCRAGSIYLYNGRPCIVGLTTHLFIYLFKESGSYYKITWKDWDKKILTYVNPYFVWKSKISTEIAVLRKQLKFINKLKKKKAVARTPKMKRFPIKIQKL